MPLLIPLAASLSLIQAAPAANAQVGQPDFATEVRPILARRCFACHGNDEETREAGLRLDGFEFATADRGGFPAIVPGSVDDSELFHRVTDDIDPMPPEESGEPLSADEVELLRRWIESGAEYSPHWSFVAPERASTDGASHAVDYFVERALTERGLTLSPPADDYTLLRRLSLDLTGLPPTPEAAAAFADSTAPDRIERAIDDLLSSPGYAERWAAVWLDLARYADSSGHGSDPLREIWRYRDWVIDAFDRNMPFDEFTVQQLAGDLLPNATVDQRLATAFHRNTMTNTEGGTDDEEFRVLAVKDRVATTMQVFMGLTAGCAECHSHKYDPISHVEYYQLFDLFNQTADADRNDDAPRLATPTAEQQPEFDRLSAAIAALEAQVRDPLASVDPHELRSQELALLRSERMSAWTSAGFAESIESSEGEALVDGDGVASFSGEGDVGERSAVLQPLAAAPTAVRLETLRSDDLPKGGPGAQPASGNFVLSALHVRARAASSAPVLAAAVRVELPGSDRILSLAEVELIDGSGDVIAGAFASAAQSSVAYDGPAGLAIDGRTDGAFASGSVTHTETEANPHWTGSLADPQPIGGVRLWPRTDGGLAARMHGLRVVFLDADGNEAWRSALAPAPESGPLVVGPVVGEPLRLTASSATHEQRDFGAELAVDGRLDPRKGWAVGGATGLSHAAVFELPPLDGPRRLEVTMEHGYGAQHLPGRIRLSVTSAAEPPVALSEADLLVLATDPGERSDGQLRDARELLERHTPVVQELQAQLLALREEKKAAAFPTTPVMVELPPDARRTTHVLTRGNFLQRGEEVEGAVPAVFPQLPDGVEPDRLALARWLVADDNPLTARVTVNRVWARLFGRGLVATEGDFGSQGELPTHPELLDWLAVEFRTGGWDHRELLRTIVTSRAYQQSSRVTEASMELDPRATWLSRFPRQRLEAEMVRDTALAASGVLSRRRFGPSIFPPQPDGLWKAAFNGQRNWMVSEGEDRYRRGVYVFLRRTIPYPMLATFDAPSRETCTVQRIPTNTPLQAFVTLNDPVFVEASRALSRRARGEADAADVDEVLEHMLWMALSRPPAAEQVEILRRLYGDAVRAFTEDPEAAAEFAAADPQGDEGGLPQAERAAWTLVASAVLNLDGVLTKE